MERRSIGRCWWCSAMDANTVSDRSHRSLQRMEIIYYNFIGWHATNHGVPYNHLYCRLQLCSSERRNRRALRMDSTHNFCFIFQNTVAFISHTWFSLENFRAMQNGADASTVVERQGNLRARMRATSEKYSRTRISVCVCAACTWIWFPNGNR